MLSTRLMATAIVAASLLNGAPAYAGYLVQEAHADAHKRAYAALLMAFASGMRITIFDYASDACTGGSYVEIYH
jgi:hypothetical protein